jgi:hypothetical protein
MRWFRRGQDSEAAAATDPAQQESLAGRLRTQFGGTQVPYREQVRSLTPLLAGDDGLLVAVRIVHEVDAEADQIIARQTGQSHRGNYRPLWRSAGPRLRPPLQSLTSGWHPYIQLGAALDVIAANADRCLRITNVVPLQARILDLLDLTLAGWEWGGTRADADAADLVNRLITAAEQLRNALKDPPPLPPGIREAMRRNNVTPVVDPANGTALGGLNAGARMREAFLT